MATKLAYLEGFGIVTCNAMVTAVQTTDDGRVDVQLDSTCFYPRGGGQDWDTGIITSIDGTDTFTVEEVRLDEQGVVHHIGRGKCTVGSQVTCAVDTERRTSNTRLHSAGHLVDMAVDALKSPLVPVRGAHYPHMSFVEYDGELAPEEAASIRLQIEQIARDLVVKGGDNELRFMPVSEMHTICRHVPKNLPANKPARVVIYNGTFGVPCGGTHVANLHDIGMVTITKVKSKKGLTKVSYTVDGIN